MLEDGAMSIERRVEALAKAALFQNLPANALAELAAHCSQRKLRQGQVLFASNEPAAALYVILSGSVRAFRTNIDGREQTIHVERAGGLLTESRCSMADPILHPRWRKKTRRCFSWQNEDVRRFMLRNPETALAALALMAKKLRNVASLAEQLALKDVGQRLAALLLEEAEQTSPQLRNGVSFSLPLSHTQLAARLGTVREVVTRGLQKLTHQGILEVHGHRILVLDVKALRAQVDAHSKSSPTGAARQPF